MSDRSNGYELIADRFLAVRSDIGVEVVRDWARTLPVGGAILDIGCGSGWPVATTLAEAGHRLVGIDPSPTLLAAFRRALPDAETACEAAEDSRFFGRRFDGAVAVGLLFLLPEAAQATLIARVGRALHAGGGFLFTAPRIAATWRDMLTGRVSRSLGKGAYRALLAGAGFHPPRIIADSGGNDWFTAVAGSTDRA
ncbi:class I SAM-dependent methyltransferase [Sphingomonas sp. Leaf10]|uniref:class I SAM-dependent methyltransferase n=1 Tax=Sphingomonas sp. Leaf10 TaxID=1735676 RepID=UPI000700CBA1|nr:class I SAM-dependent methyltransferase [Sphingomonas sp. Leaf10]KQM36633.1 methyltransferase [Sphingomonas sp. Leaf10]